MSQTISLWFLQRLDQMEGRVYDLRPHGPVVRVECVHRDPDPTLCRWKLTEVTTQEETT